jgi:hypothetical protein
VENWEAYRIMDDDDEPLEPKEEPLENPAIEIVMAHLYDLDKEELRRVAWEALLVSDGPDRQFANEHEQAGQVSQFEVDIAVKGTVACFWLVGKRGWTT